MIGFRFPPGLSVSFLNSTKMHLECQRLTLDGLNLQEREIQRFPLNAMIGHNFDLRGFVSLFHFDKLKYNRPT